MIIIKRSFFEIAGCFTLVCVVFLTQSAIARSDNKPVLSLPVDCALGKDCFVQNFVDIDGTKAVRDPKCGLASYNGHKGTDFALLSLKQMANGVRVIAALPGKVLGVRNGMADGLIRSPAQYRALPKNRYCGNGVLVGHENGWQTQYCHMRRGSIIVKKGDLVKTGQMLGLIGLSGMTTFPHLHLSLRHKNKVVDPFTGKNPQTRCVKGGYNLAKNSLWNKNIQGLFAKQSSFFLLAGFSDHKVSRRELRLKPPSSSLKTTSPMLILYTSIANIEEGDQLKFQITDPTGKMILSKVGKVLPRHKARFMQFMGKRKPPVGWRKGQYTGQILLIRNKKQVLLKKISILVK